MPASESLEYTVPARRRRGAALRYAPWMIRLVLVCVAVVAVGCSKPSQTPPVASSAPAGAAAAPDPWALEIKPVTLAIAANSGEPQLTRHAGGTVLSWLELGSNGSATLKFSERAGDGAWSAPRPVASGKDWFVSAVDVPSVARLADGSLVAQWLKTVDITIEAYDLLLSTSHDNGRTWSTPFKPHHDETRSQHGFASVFPWSDPAQPGYGVVWLDGRKADAKDPENGPMTLYYARYDRAGKQTAEAAINERVCECCSTSVAMTSAGPIAAFRDRSEKEVRDIHVSRFENGAWSDPLIVHADNWTIDSCPVNGPSIAASGTAVAVAWFTAKNDEGHAYAAFSKDGGRSFGEPLRLDDATSTGHVGIEMLDDGSAAATYLEFAGQRTHLRVRRVDASGRRSVPVEIAGSGAPHVGGVPRVGRVGNELVFAWTESMAEGDEGPGQQVRLAAATIPK
jgi:hypothetical protein